MLYGCVPPGSTQNVQSSVVVSVEREATRAFNPSGRQVEVLEQFTTVRAAFGGIGRVNKHHLTTSIYRFVRQQLFEDAPSRVQNALAQVVVTHHVANFQIFTGDQIVVLYQRIAEFMREVSALDLHQRLRPVLTAFFLAGKRALQSPQFLLSVPVELRVFDFLTVAGGDERGDPHIHAHPASRFGQRRFVRHVADKTGVPPSGFVYNANRLDLALNRSVPANRNPAYVSPP